MMLFVYLILTAFAAVLFAESQNTSNRRRKSRFAFRAVSFAAFLCFMLLTILEFNRFLDSFDLQKFLESINIKI